MPAILLNSRYFRAQISVTIKGFFSFNRAVPKMREHIRDFLVQIKVSWRITCRSMHTAKNLLILTHSGGSWRGHGRSVPRGEGGRDPEDPAGQDGNPRRSEPECGGGRGRHGVVEPACGVALPVIQFTAFVPFYSPAGYGYYALDRYFYLLCECVVEGCSCAFGFRFSHLASSNLRKASLLRA